MTLKWGLLCEKTERSSKAMPPVTRPPRPSPTSPGPPTLLGLRPPLPSLPPPPPRRTPQLGTRWTCQESEVGWEAGRKELQKL